MVRVSPPQHGFASGELSPQLWGRPDFARYGNGAELARGFVVIAEGSALRLPGTRHVGRTAGDAQARLTPAVLFDADSYMLEWSDELLRFWREGALVESGASPYALATPYLEADLEHLQWVPSGDRLRLVDGRQQPQRLTRTADDDWTIAATPFEEGPFLSQNLDETRQIVASDVTGSVTLTADFDAFTAGHVGAFWALSEVDQDLVPEWQSGDGGVLIDDRVRYDGNVYACLGYGTIGSPGPGGQTTGPNPPVHTEGKWQAHPSNGPIWQFIHGDLGILKITAVTDAQTATADVLSGELPAGVAVGSGTYRWREGVWSTARGWPRAIIELDQRALYGGSQSDPLNVFFSEIGGFERFRPSTLADGSFNYLLTPPRRRQSRVLWIEASGGYVYIGTKAGIIVGRATDDSQGFTLETTRFYPGPTGGVSEIQAENIDGRPVYLSADRMRLYSLVYELESDRTVADPQTMAARHILAPGVAWTAWQELPWRVLWLGLADGAIVSLTMEPDPRQQVVGFGRHSLGGFCESGAVKPTDDDTGEELWLSVRRTIGGETRRHVEIMAQPFGLDNGPDDPPDLADAWHLMSAVRYQGAAATVLPAMFGHLEGEEVWAWTELGAFGPFTVADAAIPELPEAVTSAIVGIDVSDSQRLRTLDIQAGAADGGAEGRLKAMRGVGARLLHSAGGTARTIQRDPDGTERESPAVTLLDLSARRFQSPPRLFSGVVDIDPKFGWSHELKVEFRPEPGAPLTIQSVTPTIMATDG